MTFEQQLLDILEKIKTKQETPQYLFKNVQNIAHTMMEKILATDAEFASYFVGFVINETFIADVMLQPNEYDVYIKLKLPHTIRVEPDSRSTSTMYLSATTAAWQNDCKLVEPFFHGYYVNGMKLRVWLQEIFNSIFIDKELILQTNVDAVSEESQYYQLKCEPHMQRFNFARSISIVDQQQLVPHKLVLHFMPVFQFNAKDWSSSFLHSAPNESWFALPVTRYSKHVDNDFTFTLCATPYQMRRHIWRAIQQNSQPHRRDSIILLHTFGALQQLSSRHLENCMILLSALKAFKDMNVFSVRHLIEAVYLWELERQCDGFWHKSMIELLFELINCLIEKHRTSKLQTFYTNFDDEIYCYKYGSYSKRWGKMESVQKSLQVIKETLKNCQQRNEHSRELIQIFNLDKEY